MKNDACGGQFSRLYIAKSSVLWTLDLGFLLHGWQELTSAEIQLLGELWPQNKV